MLNLLEHGLASKTTTGDVLASQVQFVHIAEIVKTQLEQTNVQPDYQYLLNNAQVLAHMLYGDKQVLRRAIERKRLSEIEGPPIASIISPLLLEQLFHPEANKPDLPKVEQGEPSTRQGIEPRRVFIAYEHGVDPDDKLAWDLCTTLETWGHKPIIDLVAREDESWSEEIYASIQSCDVFIVLFSEHSAYSELVRAEIEKAYEFQEEFGHPQILLIRVAYQNPLPYYFSSFLIPPQEIIWEHKEDTKRVIQEILDSIARSLPVQRQTIQTGIENRSESQVINRIAWDIHYGLPNPKYLKFVERYIGITDDPFIIEVSSSDIEYVYVGRERVENMIYRPGWKIILGRLCSGKSTLVSKSRHIGSFLYVNLSLTEADFRFSGQNAPNTQDRALTPDFLAQHIFNSYWEQMIRSLDRQPAGQYLRRNKSWMLALRWFYNHYPPEQHTVTDDFELMAWLNSSVGNEPFNLDLTPEEILRELINFVIHPMETYIMNLFGPQLKEPYNYIQVFIDTDHLSDHTVSILLQDMQMLKSQSSRGLDINLLLDSIWTTVAEKSIKSDDILLYHLPPWSPEELHDLLVTRIAAKPPYLGFRNEFKYKAGLPPDILRELREVLSRCPEFEDNAQLHAVFVDARIAGWRYGLPATSNIQARIDAVIEYLLNSYNDKSENILILFLSVLSDLRAPTDQLHLRLQ